ncbi:MAG: hypothetical protein FWG65_05400 [Turicibacter sp.]|nr:hypothetical protein [Turicibacter sp.]
MANLMIFENTDFGKIRTVEINNELWFVARDIAKSLGYRWQVNLISHVPEEWKGVNQINTPGGTQKMNILSEQGLYFFLGRSDKPATLPFQKWIAGEILPQIRKTGGYLTPNQIEEALLSPDTIIRLATEIKSERQRKAVAINEIHNIAKRLESLANGLITPSEPPFISPLTGQNACLDETCEVFESVFSKYLN